MKTYRDFIAGEKMSQKEIIKAIGDIAQDLMVGEIKALAAGHQLEKIRYNLMNIKERAEDYQMTVAELAKKAGSVKSEKKSKASIENGKLGGRPKIVKKEAKLLSSHNGVQQMVSIKLDINGKLTTTSRSGNANEIKKYSQIPKGQRGKMIRGFISEAEKESLKINIEE